MVSIFTEQFESIERGGVETHLRTTTAICEPLDFVAFVRSQIPSVAAERGGISFWRPTRSDIWRHRRAERRARRPHRRAVRRVRSLLAHPVKRLQRWRLDRAQRLCEQHGMEVW